MKYTFGQIAKALTAALVAAAGAAGAAAGGVDVTALDPGQWMIVLGAALTAGGGVFATPNKPTQAPVEQVVSGVQQVLEQSAAAAVDLKKVQEAIGSVVGVVPGMGPLAQQVINSTPTPFDPNPQVRAVPVNTWSRP